METMSTVGLDLAKSVFQVHAIAADGKVRVRRIVRRTQVLAFFGRLAAAVSAWRRAAAPMSGLARSPRWAIVSR